MAGPDEPTRLGGALRFERPTCRTFWFAGGAYVVDVIAKLTEADLRDTVDAIYKDPETLRPHAVIFREGEGAGYERNILTFYERDVPRPMPVLVGVVARRTGIRMVAMAVSLGFRAVTGVRLVVHDDLIGALVAARLAVAEAG